MISTQNSVELQNNRIVSRSIVYLKLPLLLRTFLFLFQFLMLIRFYRILIIGIYFSFSSVFFLQQRLK